ncbi:MAG: CPBP family intramembrane glutamic endopeptidase [Phycisphaerales bacterium]
MLELAVHLAIYVMCFGASAWLSRRGRLAALASSSTPGRSSTTGAIVRALVLTAAIYATQGLALHYGQRLPVPDVLKDSGWNWMGKAAGVIAALAFLPILNQQERRECGLSVRLRNGWLVRSLPVVVFLVAAPIFFARNAPHEAWSTDTILFQATMPGLGEELVYRGLMLGVLNSALLRPWRAAGVNFGPGLILTSIMFAVAHSVVLDQAGSIRVEWFTLVRTGVTGLLYGYLMEACGTLLAPIAAHNLSNVGRFLFVMLAR